MIHVHTPTCSVCSCRIAMPTQSKSSSQQTLHVLFHICCNFLFHKLLDWMCVNITQNQFHISVTSSLSSPLSFNGYTFYISRKYLTQTYKEKKIKKFGGLYTFLFPLSHTWGGRVLMIVAHEGDAYSSLHLV